MRAGADFNIQDKYGWTALMFAIREYDYNFYDLTVGHYKIVATLVRVGADVNIKSKQGETALTLAKSKGIIKLIKKMLKKRGTR